MEQKVIIKHIIKKNDVKDVPIEIQGKAKTGNKKASPIE
jgi:hypothetical protein